MRKGFWKTIRHKAKLAVRTHKNRPDKGPRLRLSGGQGLRAYRAARRKRYAAGQAEIVRPLFLSGRRFLSNLLNLALLYTSSTIEKMARGKFNRVNGVIVVVTLLVLLVSYQYFQIGVAIYIGDEQVGVMRSQQDYDRVAAAVEKKAVFYLDRPYALEINPTFQLIFAPRDEFISEKTLEARLFASIDQVQPLYVLYVDGKEVGAYKTREPYEQVLEDLKNRYKTNMQGETRVEFNKTVEILYDFADLGLSKTPEEVMEILTSRVPITKEYVAVAGDSLSLISSRTGLPIEELAALNPSLKVKGVYPGDTVIMHTTEPFISVQTVVRTTYDNQIAYTTRTQSTDTLYKGTSKVSQKGAYGIERVTADVYYVNGVQIKKEIVDTVRVSEPREQIVLQGTKTPPPTATTGQMIRPFNGRISSNYGYRGREFHTGVDFAGAAGSPVVAADGGVVTMARYNGNYGRCVIIKHDNGLETLYAHNSALTVSVGQRVAKGQQIAKVGSTGRSTGPHCHFEVRKNGKPVNPWNYIR